MRCGSSFSSFTNGSNVDSKSQNFNTEVAYWSEALSSADRREMEMENQRSSSVTIIHNATIVTMDSESRVFRDGGIVIDQDKIKAIGQSPDILAQFSAIAHHIIDLHRQFLLPGSPPCP